MAVGAKFVKSHFRKVKTKTGTKRKLVKATFRRKKH
jgi:hypothetical protein